MVSFCTDLPSRPPQETERRKRNPGTKGTKKPKAFRQSGAFAQLLDREPLTPAQIPKAEKGVSNTAQRTEKKRQEGPKVEGADESKSRKHGRNGV